MNSPPRVEAADIAHFLAFGFVHLRGWLTADEVTSVPLHYQQIVLMANNTPFSMSLLVDDPRFLTAAAALLGRSALPMPASATRQMGDTGWHADYPSGRPRTRLGFGHYFEPLTFSTGALRFLPATHLLPSFDAFNRYLTDHCPKSSASIDHIGGQAVETQPGDVVAFDGRVLHASRGGQTRLRWNLAYYIEPATPEELTDHRDSLQGYAPMVDHPAGEQYPLYTDWAANCHHHPNRAAMIDRMTKLDLLRIPA